MVSDSKCCAFMLILGLWLSSTPTQAVPGDSQVAAGPTGSIDVLSEGVKGDGVSNDSPTLQRLIERHNTATLYFPPGIYVLHNRGTDQPGLTLRGFSGKLQMAKGAVFACDTADATAGQCLWVIQSRGVTFDHVTITYLDRPKLPLARKLAVSNALLIEDSREVVLQDTTVLGSTGSGIWNTNSHKITYSGKTTIADTSADGLHFENVGEASVTNLVTDDTGDDALGITNIAKSNPNCGLKAVGIHIRKSHSRGIATAGACDATFADITIEGTASSGIAATQDLSIASRPSTHITFSKASITGAGSLAGISGYSHCIDIGGSQFITVSDVSCSFLKKGGASIYDRATNVQMDHVSLNGPRGNGFEAVDASYISFSNDRVTEATGSGFQIQGAAHIKLSNCRTDGAGAYGFYHSGSSDVTEWLLVARNSAKMSGSNRAWWAENMNGDLSVDGLTVIDDQPDATGFVIGDYDNKYHSITLKDVSFRLAHGLPSIETNGNRGAYQLRGR